MHEDVKNAGVIRQQEQFDAIKKRIADLEAKINGFNDELEKLNEEESSIIERIEQREISYVITYYR